ncbi:hypothetical protein JTB14_004840 [Gonioctena quinquepunctata]|nr:hypothetical protein JTB14_004840 [Gonioctena quinquepunctata]
MYNKILVDENNYLAYNTLKEVLYTQIILLNRRRPAQIKVQTYTPVNWDSRNENEFENCLTETEKVLLTSCSSIVIRGKRGRGVPILLSVNVRKHFDCLNKIRNNFVSHNDYVFHTIGDNSIDGTKVLYKYAKKCGVRCPKSISATRLRKHLATVTQLLQFSEKDLEQLSKFMGHTLNIHCNVYAIGQFVPNCKGNTRKSFYAAHLAETKISISNTRKSFNAAHLGGACEAGFHPITPRRHDIKETNNENNEERNHQTTNGERNFQRRKKTTKKENNEEKNLQRRKKPSKKKETNKENEASQRQRIYHVYMKARNKAKEAEQTSDPASEKEIENRRKRIQKVLSSSGSSDESILPSPLKRCHLKNETTVLIPPLQENITVQNIAFLPYQNNAITSDVTQQENCLPQNTLNQSDTSK